MMLNNNNNYLPGIPRMTSAYQSAALGQGQHMNSATPVMPQLLSNNQQCNNLLANGCEQNVSINNMYSGMPMHSNDDCLRQESDMLGLQDFNNSRQRDIYSNLPSNICEHQGQGLSQSQNFANWNSVQSPVLSSASPLNGGRTTFTFTSPTQSTLCSPGLTVSTQNRFYQARVKPQTFAPSGFTLWQHSVPKRIPWSASSPQQQQGVAMFAGSLASTIQSDMVHNSSSQAVPQVTSSSMHYPVPSCSTVPRRPKRHSSENLEYLSPTNKVRLTDEKISQHMEDLSLHCTKQVDSQTYAGFQTTRVPGLHEALPETPPGGRQSRCSMSRARSWPSHARGGDKKLVFQTKEQQWQNFKDLEERLDVSDEDVQDENTPPVQTSQPKLHIVTDISKIINPQTVLPKEILNEIQKPCMEIMLWAPPGDGVRKGVPCDQDIKPDTQQYEPLDTKCTDSMDRLADYSRFSVDDDDGCMDMDMLDDNIML